MTEQSASAAQPAPDTTPADAPRTATEGTAIERPSVNGHTEAGRTVEALEAELADWQRRAVMWRERALSTQALNEALTKNLEDLRAMLQLRATLDAARAERTSGVERAPAEQWWTKVFRRETWTTRP